MEFIEKKYKDSVITIDPDIISDPSDLYVLLKNEMKSSIRYSLLLRVSYSDIKTGVDTQYKMLDQQLGFTYKSSNDLKKFSIDLLEAISKRLQFSMETYKYIPSDIITIQILLFRVGKHHVEKKVTINKNTFLNERSMICNTNSIINRVKSFNLKEDRSNYGILLDKFGCSESIKLLSGEIVKVNSILFKYSVGKVKLNYDTDFYQNDDNEIIIVNTMNGITYVSVYTLAGMHITDLEFEVIGKDHYICKISTVKLYIKRGNVYKKEIDINLSPVYAQTEAIKTKRMVQPDWRIGSFDLEAYTYEDNAYTYAIGFSIKDEVNTYYIDEDLDSDKLILNCLNNMVSEKYSGYTFYCHNMTNYDIYFILKVLVDNSDDFTYEPCFRDDQIISIKISRKHVSKGVYKNGKLIHEGGKARTYTIKIVDSYNMLQAKLSKLCQTFGTEVSKGNYPYEFVNKNNLFYVGPKPDIKFYNDVEGMAKEDKLKQEEYDEISNDWDLKKETIKYLKSDLVSLFQVMEVFNKKIYIDYNIQANKSLTISSLSMDIFLRRYYNKNIPLIKQKHIYSDIKESYYGGITEVYKPYGKDLYYYDVNSLYPYSALNAMPGTKCLYSDNIGQDFGEISGNLFGFYYCKIKTSDLYIGLLPYRGDEGLTMPLGEFEGWYFSEELRYAHEKGYNIQVIKGYSFNRVENVFKDYINQLYNIKCTTTSDVQRQIVKSLLNNLLGRFGLDINKYVTSIVDKEEFNELIQTRKIRGVRFMGEGKTLLSYEESINRSICEDHSLDFKETLKKLSINPSNKFVEDDHHDVSVAISSAVTSYSRVFMNKIKMNILDKGGNIYYTDTDSIVSDIALEDSIVGNGLGQFKLEHKIIEGYFVSSKTYAFTTLNKKGEEIVVTKNKGVNKNSLGIDKFKELYANNEVEAQRFTSRRDYVNGGVVIRIPDKITLNPNSYRKRIKIFDNGKWVDTKPIKRQSYHTNIHPKYIRLICKLWSPSNYIYLYLLSVLLITISSQLFSVGLEGMESVNNIEVKDIISNTITSSNEEINTISNKHSLVQNFLDLFNTDKRLEVNKVKFDYISHREPDTINKIQNYYMEELDRENLELKDRISLLEVQVQRYKIMKLNWDNTTDSIVKELSVTLDKYSILKK